MYTYVQMYVCIHIYERGERESLFIFISFKHNRCVVALNVVTTPTDPIRWSQNLACNLSPTNTALHCREVKNFEAAVMKCQLSFYNIAYPCL